MNQNRMKGLGAGFISGLVLFFQIANVPIVKASDELDRLYSLERIGVLKVSDNVDGIFQETMADVYKRLMQKHTRFIPVDMDEANRIFRRSNVSYDKWVNDSDVLHQLARSLRAESLLRTTIQKEPGRYRFKLEWIHSAKMDILASETVLLQEPKTGAFVVNESDLSRFIEPVLNTLFSKVPFLGQVTGRDGSMVTLNIGAFAGLEMGDTVWLATIDEVKKHPLLKTIEGWETKEVGRAEIQQVDQGIAFAKIFEESAELPAKRFHKVIRIEKKPTLQDLKSLRKGERGIGDEARSEDTTDGRGTQSGLPEHLQGLQPKIGWASVGPWMGGISREYSPTGGTEKQGGGFSFGALADAQIWVNPQFFGAMTVGYGAWNHTQTDVGSTIDNPAGDASGTLMNFKIAGGYSHFLTDDFFGPKGWVKLGYQNRNYSLPNRPSEGFAATNVNGLALGLGGDVPLRPGWGMTLNFDVGVMNGGQAKNLNLGTVDGVTMLDFQIGLYARIRSHLAVKGTFEFFGDTLTFMNGSTLSHRMMSFSPSIVFYF